MTGVEQGVRDYAATLVIGGKGSGKSSLLMKEAIRYNKKTGRRVFIHDPSESKAFSKIPIVPLEKIRNGQWKKGIARNCSLDYMEVNETISIYFKNGMVVLDEFTTYVLMNPSAWQKYLLTNHRNRGIDVVYVFHRYTSVPMYFGTMAYRFICFRTWEKNLTINNFSKRFSLPDQIYEAYEKLKDPTTGFRKDFQKKLKASGTSSLNQWIQPYISIHSE